MGKEKLYIPISINGTVTFRITDVIEEIKAHVDEYNAVQSTEEYYIVNIKVVNIGCSCREYQLNEFVRAMSVLLLAREGRLSKRAPWLLNTDIAFESGVPEIYRELVSRAANTYYFEDVRRSLTPLSNESTDENVADIMGIITDELGELSEDDYEELLEDFAPLLVQWKTFDVSKYKDEEVYELVYEIIRRCYEHKAYRTATRLSGLLYIADEPEKRPNLGKTNLLMGKIMYELRYMDVAKRCFMFADGDTCSKCWEGVPEKYRMLLGQETKIEITEEILERQKFIDDGIASGKITAYTRKELDEHIYGKQRVKLPDPKEQENERKKIAEKALNTYGKYANGDASERLKGIDAAFAVFTEESEVYEEAAHLYFLKANIYLEENDLENAYACIKKAYGCKNGNKNGMVLLTTAIILSKMGRSTEANVYIFRCCILFGKGFVVEKIGESAMEALEKYLS